MNKFKKFAIYAWVFLQILVIAYLWIIMILSAFSPGKSLGDYIHWEWWVMLFTLDLWTAKFFKELPKTSE